MFWRKDGTAFPVSYVSSPMVDQGRITGSVVSCRNLSARLAKDSELNEGRNCVLMEQI